MCNCEQSNLLTRKYLFGAYRGYSNLRPKLQHDSDRPNERFRLRCSRIHSGTIKEREMKRFFTSHLYSTGRPAPTCLEAPGSHFLCSASSTHSFHKRRGETVHIMEGPHFAVAHQFHFFGMPCECLRGPAQLKLTRTVRFSSNIRIQISLANAMR